jgi:TatD DNase family protein
MNQDMIPLLDAHLHIESSSLSFNPDQEYWINGTHEKDWPLVLNYMKNPVVSGYAGIHPWYIERTLSGWEQRLENILNENPRLGAGEFGLDRIRKETPLEQQLYFFETQLELALKLNRPVVLHCVKAFDLLFESLKKRNISRIHGILHRFESSVQVMEDLLDKGFYISFFYTLHTREKLQKAFKACPPDRMLLESDAGDGPDDGELEMHYSKSARLLGISQHELINRIQENGQIFKNQAFSR